MNFILKVTKFLLQENYSKVCLFTFTLILIDFSGIHILGKKKLTSICWFSNTVISKIFEILFSAEFIFRRFITFPWGCSKYNFFIFQTILWILMVFKNCRDLLLYRLMLQQETWKCLGLLLYSHFFSFAHLAVTYTAHCTLCRLQINNSDSFILKVQNLT